MPTTEARSNTTSAPTPACSINCAACATVRSGSIPTAERRVASTIFTIPPFRQWWPGKAPATRAEGHLAAHGVGTSGPGRHVDEPRTLTVRGNTQEDAMRHGATLTVGYDGSPASTRAARWAVDTAASHDATVRIVACCDPLPPPEPWFDLLTHDPTAVADDAERRVVAMVAGLARHAGVNVEHQVIAGPPMQRLVEAAASSDVLVVGNSGHRTFDAWRLGSVAYGVARHSRCPVVLVPDVEPPPPFGRIVVGVDGSPASTAALMWACDEADDRDAELFIVHIWDYPYATELGSPTARDLTRVDAALQLEASVRLARDRCRERVEDILVEGSATTELIASSRRADLVVLGTRGRSAVRAAVFGSVSHGVAARAACPVVVVHDGAHR
jgi:nucleotide-binding universal stress UspA family protein